MAVGTPTSVMAASWARAKAPRALGLGYPPLPGTDGGSPTLVSPVFPQAPLGVEVDLWTGVWTEISRYVYQRDPIYITDGRSNEASQASPSQCGLTLKNGDGRFSFNNPLGAYYGQLARNAPLRVSVPTSVLPAPYNSTYLRIEDDATSYASCPASSALQQVTGSLDVRVDVDLTGYGQLTLAAVWAASAGVDQRCWKLGMLTTGQLNLAWSTAGTSGSVLAATSSAQTPLPFGRLVIRATLDATTGNVAFYTGPAGGADAGPWTQLGSTIAGSGATSVFASASAPMTVGFNAGLNYDNANIGGPTGAFYDAELRSGINGTAVARPAFYTVPVTTTSWVDVYGNTWSTAGTAEISGRHYRFHGEFSGVPKATDPTVTDVYSQATASGIMRRLSQGQSPLNSPLYRAYVRLTGTQAPVAYWPCEDGPQATQIASGLPNGLPMTFNGHPQFASNSGFIASDALPVLNGSAWAATVPAQASWSVNDVSFLLQVPSGGDTDGALVVRLTCTGTVTRMDLVYNTASGGSLTINCYGGSTLLGTSGAVTFGTGGINGLPLLVDMQIVPSGGNLSGTFSFSNLAGSALGVGGTALFAGTLGAVTAVQINPGGPLSGSAVGHVAVSTNGTTSGALGNALTAWIGESAGARVARLCAEEGINCRIYGHRSLSTLMGAQSISTLTELLQECESTDRGMLYEPRTCLGIGYRTVASLYNQTAVATVSFTGAGLDQGLVPTTDDLMTQNDVTANNLDGSSARQILASGAMSIQAPPNGIGRADTTISVNTWPDTTLPSIANWALHIGTDGHDRFPTLPFNLARSETPNSIALLRIGDLHTVTSPPPWIQYDEIDQLVAGRSETLGPFAVWQIDTNAIPAYPYVIAEIAGGVSPATHVDTDGSTLTSDITATGTALSFSTTDPVMPAWTTGPTDYPFDVAIGGERITITSPGTGRNADPLLLQGLSTYTADSAGIALSAAMGVPEAARGYSTQVILVTPAGSPATQADVHGAAMGAGSIGTSAAYTVWAWVYSTAGRTYQLFANWKLSGVYVSTTIATGTAVPAGVWTLITASITSPASGINQAEWGVVDGSSPTTAMTFGAWGINAARTSNISTTSPQTMTGIRSINGVVKGQSAGSDVRLWFPPIVGL